MPVNRKMAGVNGKNGTFSLDLHESLHGAIELYNYNPITMENTVT